jgi:hypothetical protein
MPRTSSRHKLALSRSGAVAFKFPMEAVTPVLHKMLLSKSRGISGSNLVKSLMSGPDMTNDTAAITTVATAEMPPVSFD